MRIRRHLLRCCLVAALATAALPATAGAAPVWTELGAATPALNTPQGVAVDNHGNVFVANTGAARIAKYDSTGPFVTSFGGTGNGLGQMNTPTGVGVDHAGNICFADQGNDHVQKLTSTGTFPQDFGAFSVPTG